MKVLYVAGQGRCGSTLLGRLLGQQPTFVYAGEVMNLWSQWDAPGALCSCGDSLQLCQFWSSVMKSCWSGSDRAERTRLAEIQSAACRTAKLPLWAFDAWKGRTLRQHPDYFNQLASLYRSIAQHSGASVIVDTSKVPTYGVLLGTISEVDLHVLHMIRDPRAVAYSWTRTKLKAPRGAEVMATYSPLRSAVRWDAYNLGTTSVLTRGASRSMRLLYEDFVLDPRGSLEAVVRFVAEEPDLDRFPTSNEASMIEPLHSVSGNPNRFAVGAMPIRADDEWREEMRQADRVMVSAATWPVRRWFGYT